MNIKYNTGIEIYSIENHNKGGIMIEESINNLQDYLTHRNPEKYKDFLDGLEKIKIVLLLGGINKKEERLEILRKMYYALRLYDDIIDGDTLEKINYNERLQISNQEKDGLYDILINQVKDIAEEIGKLDGINYSINEIVSSINFDLNRIMDNKRVRKKSELNKNFHKMDIDGTIYGTAIIFGLNPKSAISKLDSLGEATRKAYNLNDLTEDIKEGLINIPEEDLLQFGISEDDLEKIKLGKIPRNIENRIDSEIDKINNLLKNYNNKFGLFSILSGKGIELEDNSSYFKNLVYNLILKYIVLPKGYVNEIQKILKISSK